MECQCAVGALLAESFHLGHEVNVLAAKGDLYQSCRQKLLLPVGILLLCGLSLATAKAAQSQNLAELSARGKAALPDQQFDHPAKLYDHVNKLDPRSARTQSDPVLARHNIVTY